MLALCAGAVGFTVAISGATGGLGRELCQQSVDRGWNTLALTRNTGSRVIAPNRYAGMVDVSGKSRDGALEGLPGATTYTGSAEGRQGFGYPKAYVCIPSPFTILFVFIKAHLPIIVFIQNFHCCICI